MVKTIIPSDAARSFNDDLAEKSSRREQHSDSSRQPVVEFARDTRTRANSRNNDTNTSQNASSRGNTTSGRRVSGRLAPVQADFDQWMALIRNNRINATNTWNFPLIDYFQDLSVLRDGESINFQKASMTLDGCVKVYTSRVDSVSTETNRLLTGLVANRKLNADDPLNEDNDNAEAVNGSDSDASDDENAPKAKRKTKTKKYRSGDNIVKPEKLELDMDELKNTIDPLFRKMCADFDEGGAKGLLLNSLVCDRNGMMSFDGEAVIEDESVDSDLTALLLDQTNGQGRRSLAPITEEEEEEDQEEGQEQQAEGGGHTESANDQADPAGSQVSAATDSSTIKTRDLAMYSVCFFPDPTRIAELTVCSSLRGLENAVRDPINGTENLLRDLEAWSVDDVSNDLYNGDQGFYDGNDDQMLLPSDAQLADSFSGLDLAADVSQLDRSLSLAAPSANTSSWEGSTFGSLFEGSTQWGDVSNYFDEQGSKNWAGPEHWKVQRARARYTNNLADATGAATEAGQENNAGVDDPGHIKPARQTRKPEFIDFLEGPEPDWDELFTPGKAIDLPASAEDVNDLHTLPTDMHFRARNLVRLFLKPEGRPAAAFIRLRAPEGMGGTAPGPTLGRQDEESEGIETANDAFQAALNDFAGDVSQDIQGYDANYYNDHGHDAQDDIGFDNDDDGRLASPFGINNDDYDANKVDSLQRQSTWELMTSRPSQMESTQNNRRGDQIQFARTARRFNVRELKSAMSKVLNEQHIASLGRSFAFPEQSILGSASAGLPASAYNETGATVQAMEQDTTSRPANQTLKLSQIAEHTGERFRPAQRNELSPSLFFINLLHIANEQGLTIKNVPGFHDLDIILPQDESMSIDAPSSAGSAMIS